jgi:hypothetical protein
LTSESLKNHKDKIIRERLKEPRDICEGVSYPVWDFVEPSHYILPELYIEIGLLNNALDNFYDFLIVMCPMLFPWLNSGIL